MNQIIAATSIETDQIPEFHRPEVQGYFLMHRTPANYIRLLREGQKTTPLHTSSIFLIPFPLDISAHALTSPLKYQMCLRKYPRSSVRARTNIIRRARSHLILSLSVGGSIAPSDVAAVNPQEGATRRHLAFSLATSSVFPGNLFPPALYCLGK